jgi:histidinol-phosphate phosphatase family protein
MSAKRPAVFLDRDGTLIADVPYVGDPAQVRLLPGSADAVQRLRRAGFACIVVSNQSAVGRGMITLDQMHAVHRELVRQLTAAGAALDGNYWCPYAPQSPDKTVIEHVDRKPGPGMLLRAARDLNLDLTNSWIIGDQASDMLAGRNAGCRGGILVRAGQDVAAALEWLGPDCPVADDLLAAAEFILHRLAATR